MHMCQSLYVEDKEQFRQTVVAELDRIRDCLRARGDHHRAIKVEKFKQEYFVGQCMHSDSDSVREILIS